MEAKLEVVDYRRLRPKAKQVVAFKCQVCGARLNADQDGAHCKSCGSSYKRKPLTARTLYGSPGEEVSAKASFALTILPVTKGQIVTYTYTKDWLEGAEVPREKLVWGSCKNTSPYYEYFYMRVIDEGTGAEVAREVWLIVPGHYAAPNGTFNYALPDRLAAMLPRTPKAGTWNLRLELVRWWAL